MGQYTKPQWGNIFLHFGTLYYNTVGQLLYHSGTIHYTTVGQYTIPQWDKILHHCGTLHHCETLHHCAGTLQHWGTIQSATVCLYTRALWDNTLHCTIVVKISHFALCMTTQTTGMSNIYIYILAHSGVPPVWPEATQNLQKKILETELKKHKLCF